MTLVLDSSAIVAILTEEPEAESFVSAIRAAEHVAISAMTLFELSVVMLRRRGPGGVQDVRDLLTAAGAQVIPFDGRTAEAATAAYARFGKGIHADARLNLGDCAAYALAKQLDAPLLFKGQDFPMTDVKVAVPI